MMKHHFPLLRAWAVGLSALAAGANVQADDAKPESPTPEAVLRRMADFYGKAKSYTVDDSRAIQAGPIPIKQTIGIAVERPNKLAIRSKGMMLGIDVVDDGETATLIIGSVRKYTQGKAPATFAALAESPELMGIVVGSLQGSLMAELIMPDPYKSILDGVTKSTYVGLEDLDGGKVHHLAFVQDQFDWEAWVAAEGDPVLRKTRTDLSKTANQKAELVHTFEGWKFDAPIPAATFAFEAPANFTKAKDIRDAIGQGADGDDDDKGDKKADKPAGAEAALLGKPAPAIDLDAYEGGKFALADHQGKSVVLVDFWATWCGPCVKELPLLIEVADAFKDKGLAFRAVNLREDKEKIAKFQATKDLKFPVALDPKGEVAKAYGVTGIPTCVLVDKAGVVRAVHVGYSPQVKDILTKEIEALLAGKDLDAKGDAAK